MSLPSILVIGCGSIGERHLRCFLHTQRVAVTACDSNPALLAAIAGRYGVATTTDWAAALQSGAYQAAVICTPAPAHIPMAIAALEAGVHVLIEKPLSHSLQGIDDLLRARDRSGLQAAVAYVYWVYPFLNQARSHLASGELGAIRQASYLGGQAFHRMRPAYAQTYYRDRRTGGGAIQDALTHAVNWVESVLGPTDSLLCDCAHQALPEVEVEDTVHISARHGDVLMNYSLNQFQAPNEALLQFNAILGSVRIEFHRQRWGVFRDGAEDWTWHDAPVTDRDAHFVAQAAAFLDQIAGAPSRLCSLEQALQSLRFNLAALASAQAERRIHCRDISA